MERAHSVLKFDERKAQLAELAQQSVRIVEITNKAGRDECHAAMMDLANARIGIQKDGKDARDDAVKFSKAVIGAEKELISVIESEEERLRKLRDGWDQAREAERAEKARVEREKIEAAERARIEAERAEEDRIRQEREAALAAERAELDRQRKELEAQQAEERKRMQAEREELERQQAEQRRIAREEEDRRAAEERKRLDDEAKARREKHEREQREAAQKRLDTLKANAPELRMAAIAAHRLLVNKGFGEESETIQLGFAIEKDAKPATKKAA